MKSRFKIEVFRHLGQAVPIEIIPKFIYFSDGTVQVQLEDNSDVIKNLPTTVVVNATLLDSIGIMALYQITDLINHYFGNSTSKNLVLSYLPYARYDRRMGKYDSHSLKVFGTMINSLNYDEVSVDDLHSHVPSGLINNLVERYQQVDTFGKSAINHRKYDYYISPDLGAIKKSQAVSHRFGVPLLVATKKRDEKTGYTVFDALMSFGQETKDKTCIILDDICDGGMTFINLAENLKKTYGFKQVDLFVSHGLFSRGRKLDHVDDVYCFNDFENAIKSEN